MYNVTLGNGTTFQDLTVNGSYFVSKNEVNSNMFNNWDGKCTITSSDEADEFALAGNYQDWELKDLRKGAHAWYFAIGEIDKARLEAMRNRADIDYIAMMTGVQL